MCSAMMQIAEKRPWLTFTYEALIYAMIKFNQFYTIFLNLCSETSKQCVKLFVTSSVCEMVLNLDLSSFVSTNWAYCAHLVNAFLYWSVQKINIILLDWFFVVMTRTWISCVINTIILALSLVEYFSSSMSFRPWMSEAKLAGSYYRRFAVSGEWQASNLARYEPVH